MSKHLAADCRPLISPLGCEASDGVGAVVAAVQLAVLMLAVVVRVALLVLLRHTLTAGAQQVAVRLLQQAQVQQPAQADELGLRSNALLYPSPVRRGGKDCIHLANDVDVNSRYSVCVLPRSLR